MKEKIPYENLERGRQFLVILFLFVSLWYLTWRLGTFNKNALIFSWLLYGAELYGFFTTIMHMFMTWRLTIRVPPDPREGATVDVFIPTFNEPVALLRKTLLAAKHIDYPHQTWLLDDGNRQEMENLAKELGCQYLCRTDNSEAKAGNLNNALLHSSAEFIAIFDADHAPKKNFLSRTLGYFTDQSVAFVQTPQDFYNLDSFQHHKKGNNAEAWHEQTVFFRVIQRGKDYWNAAFFCGSCAIIRRSSLDEIGGFATGTVTEDLHTSLKLHKKGFRSVFHAEPLAFGLAPSGVQAFLKQRIRWGNGAMQVWRKEGVFFCRGLTWAQRINYLASSITYFDGWHKGLFYIAPTIVLTTGVMPLIALGPDFLWHFIPYFILTFWVFEEVNRGYGRSLIIEQYNMIRFAAMAWSTLGIFKGKIKFAVTPKVLTTASTRLYLAPQAVILIANGLAIIIGLTFFYRNHHLPLNGIIANVTWALVNTMLAVSVTLFVSAYSKFKRAEYRFPIHLPVMVQYRDGSKNYGTIDDISSTGFRVYSKLPENTSIDDHVSGEIYLPSGPLKFSACIKSLIKATSGKEEYIKAMGCLFYWGENSEEDKLSLFLYGSDMQLSLNSLKESIQTPLHWLAKIFLMRTKSYQEMLPAHWNTTVFTTREKNEPKSGLISDQTGDNRSRKFLSFSPLPEGTQIKVDVYGRKGISTLFGTIGTSRQIESPASPLFIHQFIPLEAENLPTAFPMVTNQPIPLGA